MPNSTDTGASLSTRQLEWYDYNTHRNYPLAEDASLTDNSGMKLSCAFLVDARITMPPVKSATGDFDEAKQTASLFLSAIQNNTSVYRLIISYMPESGAPFELFYCDIPRGASYADGIQLSTYQNIPEDFADLRYSEGVVYVGSTDMLQNKGSYHLEYAAGKLDPRTVTASYTGVQALEVLDSTSGLTERLLGTVTLEAGDNIELLVDKDTNTVTINALTSVESAEAVKEKVISEIMQALGGAPITSINGYRGPNVNFVGGDCTTVTTGAGSIVISNPCAVPCCDSSDYDDIRQTIDTLNAAKDRMLNYFESLNTTITAMQARMASLLILANPQ